MARRYELTDDDWGRVAPHLPPATTRRGGRRFRDHRQVLDGIPWVLHTGAQWRELPARYGPWNTAYNRHARWRDDGTLDAVLSALHLALDAAGLVDHGLWCVDGTGVRAGRSAAGARKRGARSRPTTPSGGRGAGGARSCTWSWTATASPWPPASRRGRPARAGRSGR